MFASLHTAQLTTRKVQAHGQNGVLAQLLRAVKHGLALKGPHPALQQLDDATLADIGLSRDQVRSLDAHPSWDVPANWRV